MGERKSLSFEVIMEVAEQEGVGPTEIDVPLYSVIDPELLDRLGSESNSKNDTNLNIQFEYYGYRVTIRGEDDISVRPSQGEQDLQL
ncbi:HalOD1 output domain-containing protein [Natrinema salaciae]|uniref:Halobacterial output domain-containing protein n=1 Tax=Natrinema salaciae TaxID=1186196 RepID=A0A1H9G4H8_9EURY|nr:HalOD1 output domain-containing protein [Natrinema salaciae]SEQ44960.1 hypothetical protein SAMN04489841_1770 [Natrinema salaciae]